MVRVARVAEGGVKDIRSTDRRFACRRFDQLDGGRRGAGGRVGCASRGQFGGIQEGDNPQEGSQAKGHRRGLVRDGETQARVGRREGSSLENVGHAGSVAIRRRSLAELRPRDRRRCREICDEEAGGARALGRRERDSVETRGSATTGEHLEGTGSRIRWRA